MEQNQHTDTTPEEHTPDTASSDNDKKKSNARTIIGVVLLLIAAGALAYWVSERGALHDTNPSSDQARSTIDDLPDVVGIVNGTEVTSATYGRTLTQTLEDATRQGFNVTDTLIYEQIQSQALDLVINTELLLQAAQAAEVSIREEDVTAQLSSIEQQFASAEEFSVWLQDFGLNEELLRTEIRNQQTIDAYILASDEGADLTVTDEEVQARYDASGASGQELPPFEFVEAQIREGLLIEKQQTAVNAIITRLRSEADIELFI